MMAERIFLVLSALVWLPYGVFCFFQPGYLVQAAGVSASTVTGTLELRAMYGGLQAGIGALALVGSIRASFVRPALVALAFLCGGLGTSRLMGAVATGELSSYTAMALVFEWASASIAVWLLYRAPTRGSADAPAARSSRHRSGP